jgi:uncharacterized protein YciI
LIFTFICKDKPEALDVRMSNRPAHVDYLNGLNAEGKLKFAGPFLGEDGKPTGSLVAVEADDRAEAERIAEGDPYARAGLFESVEISPWSWTFNAPEGR